MVLPSAEGLVKLGVLSDGSVHLHLADKGGKPRATLTVEPEGSPAMVLLDKGGGITWSAP